MGYVMVSRALLQEICEKKGAACCEEEAFLRVLTNVNFKPAVVFCNGAGVQCARGESVILRPHHPPAGGERQLCPRPLEKTLHPRARTCLPESGRLLFQPEQYAFLLPGCQVSGI